MVTVTGEMIRTLLMIMVFLFVIGIITPVITWSINEDFRCRASVWLTSNNVGPGLSCSARPPIIPTERQLARENGAADFVAKEMLACHTMFNAGSSNTILSYKPFTPYIGLDVDRPITFGGRLPRGQFGTENYCIICSTIDFEDGHTIEGFEEYLLREGIGDQTYYSLLYSSSPLSSRYTEFIRPQLVGDVIIIYSEGTDSGSQIRQGVSSGVVAVDGATLNEELTSGSSNGVFATLCGRPLKVGS